VVRDALAALKLKRDLGIGAPKLLRLEQLNQKRQINVKLHQILLSASFASPHDCRVPRFRVGFGSGQESAQLVLDRLFVPLVWASLARAGIARCTLFCAAPDFALATLALCLIPRFYPQGLKSVLHLL
jgi:hypothetical protein